MASPVIYVQEVLRELNKVSWPSREQTIRMTALVLVVSILVALYLGALDFVFQSLVRSLIER